MPPPSMVPPLSWPSTSVWRTLVALAVRLLGPAPTHMALIMDGNRRYASERGMGAEDGHRRGFAKLLEALQWCRDLDVRVLTVFAFSTENFRRTPAEVEALMAMAAEKLAQLATDPRLHAREVRVRVLGELHLLPPAVRLAADKVMRATEQYRRHTLNVALAYTSREELWRAARCAATEAKARWSPDAACVEEAPDGVARWLYTAPDPPVDLLVRTSGEQRLSDFLVHQVGDAALVFVDALWPALTFWHLLAAVVRWQSFVAASASLAATSRRRVL